MYFGSTWGTSHKIFKWKWNHLPYTGITSTIGMSPTPTAQEIYSLSALYPRSARSRCQRDRAALHPHHRSQLADAAFHHAHLDQRKTRQRDSRS